MLAPLLVPGASTVNLVVSAILTSCSYSRGVRTPRTPRISPTTRTAGAAATTADRMLPAPQVISNQAAYLLRQAVKKSKRTSGIQLAPRFVRNDRQDSQPPALARMIRGGRGGEVRLKLYLTMVLIAARKPHDLENIPARAWAEMLDLDDPAGLGARRVSDAMHWLDDHDFIRLTSRRGSPPTVRLLSMLGDGQPFNRGRGVYIAVPVGLWEHLWITRLSGTGLALLLVLLDLQGGKKQSNPPSLPGPLRRRYGLSDDTWTRAGKELKDLGLLQIKKQPYGRDFDFRRMRNTYWIDKNMLNAPIPEGIQ